MENEHKHELNVVVADGMSDCLPNVQHFVSASTPLGLALKLSVIVEQFRQEEQEALNNDERAVNTVLNREAIQFYPIPYRTFLQCSRVRSASQLHHRLAVSNRIDRVLDVHGLTDEEAELWRQDLSESELTADDRVQRSHDHVEAGICQKCGRLTFVDEKGICSSCDRNKERK